MTTKNGRHVLTALELEEAVWKKSSHSGGSEGQCVEVADLTGVLLTDTRGVRDSKNPNGPALLFPESSFADFVAGVKAGELDI
ncbi:DUF397 domain-containing protein [Streptomyces sp. NPDC015350]|uniref:DUF397 domain-containing protein n=1 Tax=Streptomyces sp. NPDC015350 TaxID=3364955 RepID=UPI0036FBE10E